MTNIKNDGPTPLRNSMPSFASVIIDADGNRRGEFAAVLQPRADKAQNPVTMDWWTTQPEVWAAATTGAEPAEVVMPRFSRLG
ncbi:MAG: hypothetical protein MO846_07045 [Candidatus Devosia symbiotica]|nr:hypothetical protein [Candidatus Devosia symbiotica]